MGGIDKKKVREIIFSYNLCWLDWSVGSYLKCYDEYKLKLKIFNNVKQIKGGNRIMKYYNNKK